MVSSDERPLEDTAALSFDAALGVIQEEGGMKVVLAVGGREFVCWELSDAPMDATRDGKDVPLVDPVEQMETVLESDTDVD